MNYIKEIDGLRAIAILGVCFYHFFPNQSPYGYLGVDIFFVISGLLITNIILNKLQNNEFSITDFLTRRVNRLFPSLILVLFFVLVFGYFYLIPSEYKNLSFDSLAGIFFLENFKLLSEVGYFDLQIESKPLMHLWSLSVEEQFYIVWPALMLFSFVKLKNYRLVYLLFFISLFLYLNNHYFSINEIFYLPIFRFWELLAGAIIAILIFDNKLKIFNFINIKISKLIMTSILFLLLYLLSGYSIFSDHILRLMVVLLSSFLIIFISFNIPHPLLANRFFVYIGLISYPLYLWHWPLLSLYKICISNEINLLNSLIIFFIAFIFSVFTYEFYEKKIRTHASKNFSTTLLLVLVALSLSFYSFFVYMTDGGQDREHIGYLHSQYLDLEQKLVKDSGWLCGNLNYPNPKCSYIGANPDKVLIGDSHANSLFFGLKSLFTRLNKNFAIFGGGEGCPPLLGVISQDAPGPDTRMCLLKMTSSLNMIAKEESIKTVYLTTRGPMYFAGGDFKFKRYSDWILYFEDEAIKSKSNIEVFESGLKRTFDLLLKNNKEVIFFVDVPELGFHIKSCINRFSNITGPDYNFDCYVSYDEFKIRNIDYHKMIKRLVSYYPNVDFIYLHEALCDEKICRAKNNNTLLYIDDNHLSKRGAEFVINYLYQNDKFHVR